MSRVIGVHNVNQPIPAAVKLSELKTNHISDPKGRQHLINAISDAREWVNSFPHGNGFLLLSYDSGLPGCTGYGTGKSHIANAIITAGSTVQNIYNRNGDIIDSFTDTRYVLTMPPTALIRSFYEGQNVRSMINRNRIIFMDDIGTENDIQFVGDNQRQEKLRRDFYFQLLDKIEKLNNEGRPVSLIMTSNLSIKELTDHIGGRAMSRLQMHCGKFMHDLSRVPDWRYHTTGRGDLINKESPVKGRAIR